jgi:hypothetical protein
MAQFCQPTCLWVEGEGGKVSWMDGVVGQLRGSEKRNFRLGDNLKAQLRNATRSIEWWSGKLFLEKPKNRVSCKQLIMISNFVCVMFV